MDGFHKLKFKNTSQSTQLPAVTTVMIARVMITRAAKLLFLFNLINNLILKKLFSRTRVGLAHPGPPLDPPLMGRHHVC